MSKIFKIELNFQYLNREVKKRFRFIDFILFRLDRNDEVFFTLPTQTEQIPSCKFLLCNTITFSQLNFRWD